jgi:hypothetical protein
MTLPLADRGIDACVAALQRAGLELREHEELGNGSEYLLHGNTYANKDLLRKYGGRWSHSRQGWVFESLEPIRDLATALPANDEVPPGGLADAPATYNVERASRRFRRKHYHGHRERLRTRFLEAGPESLPDYELLELLLFHSIDIKDTKPLAKGLLARFDSLGGVISADPRLFAEFDELRENTDAFAQYHAFRSSEAYQLARDSAPESRSEETRRWLAYEESDEGRREIDLYWAGRAAAAWHGRSHSAVPARDRQARARARRVFDHHGAQPPERRPDAIARRHRDDQAGGAGDERRRPHRP